MASETVNVSAKSLKWNQDGLFIIDQQRLPQETAWLKIDTPEDMIRAIRNLSIRGAPLIGVGAAIALARYAELGASPAQIRDAAEQIRAARPTAVNLMHAMDRIALSRPVHELVPETLRKAALEIFNEDVELCAKIAENGYAWIPDGGGVLTHCNTGGLATVGVGTALGVITNAWEQGKRFHVYVDETRPLLQGARLTAWELQEAGIPSTLICDNMAGALMRSGKIQCAIVGADRIALNGDFANKTGTYTVAVLAKHHQIPFYVAAPFTTLDADCPDGSAIPVEERDGAEVLGAAFHPDNRISWSPKGMPVYNPSFDVTPVDLVTGYILDTGAYSGTDVKAGRLASTFDHLRRAVSGTSARLPLRSSGKQV